MPGLTDRMKNAAVSYLFGAAIQEAVETKAGSPGGVTAGMPGYSSTVDAFRRRRQPTRRGLLEVLKGFPFACASKNANGVAQVPLRLYVKTNTGESEPRWKTAPVSNRQKEYLRWCASPDVQKAVSRSDKLEEITSHPLLTALQNVNPWMNQFDLIRLTVLELDTTGEAYWLPMKNGFGAPMEIWPLESWRIRPVPSFDPGKVVASFEYSGARKAENYAPEDLIQFRVVSPHDPYGTGYSPMRAAFEYIELANELLAYESSMVNNRARPDLLVSPNDTISSKMARRYQERFNEQFRRGGAGGIMVAEAGFSYTPFNFSPSNMGGMDMRRACEEVIAACFDVPLSIVRVEDVNRANAEAGKYAHADLAIRPRCIMVEQKLNERFTPLYDDRLILAFDNPVPEDADRDRNERMVNIQNGITSINRERAKIGEPEIAGGEEPLVDPTKVPLSMLRGIVQQNQDEQRAGMVQQGGFMNHGAQPPNPRAVKRYIMKHFGPLIDRAVRERLEEQRLSGEDQAAAIWPDLPYQGARPES